jgi:hypothetical protein
MSSIKTLSNVVEATSCQSHQFVNTAQQERILEIQNKCEKVLVGFQTWLDQRQDLVSTSKGLTKTLSGIKQRLQWSQEDLVSFREQIRSSINAFSLVLADITL